MEHIPLVENMTESVLGSLMDDGPVCVCVCV